MMGTLESAGNAVVKDALELSQRLMSSFTSLVKFEKFMSQSEPVAAIIVDQLTEQMVDAARFAANAAGVNLERSGTDSTAGTILCEPTKMSFLLTRALEMLVDCTKVGGTIDVLSQQTADDSYAINMHCNRFKPDCTPLFAQTTLDIDRPDPDTLASVVWRTLLRDVGAVCSTREKNGQFYVSIALSKTKEHSPELAAAAAGAQ
jgi:hypothetical protein